jgi:hypothetical protein
MNMKSGLIRDLDPSMLTAALMTTALMHPGISKLIEGNNPTFSNSQEAGRAHARFWLELLTPKSAPHPWPAGE